MTDIKSMTLGELEQEMEKLGYPFLFGRSFL